MIVVSGDDIAQAVRTGRVTVRRFVIHDREVFNGLTGNSGADTAIGEIRPGADRERCRRRRRYAGGPPLLVVHITPQVATPHPLGSCALVDGKPYVITGAVLHTGAHDWTEHPVRVFPMEEDLFSRTKGLIETGALAGKCVFLKGLGTVGSTAFRLLVQSGIGTFVLMDPDRVEVANVLRHEAGISDVGRFKTHAMADLARNKNPSVKVETHETKLGTGNLDEVDEIIRRSHIVIDSGDERQGKLLLNNRCVQLRSTYIVSGAFHRAYGGQVIRVRPKESGCYQCFLNLLPKEFKMGGGEPSPELPAYANRPGPVEPGLSIDILPIAHLTAKLALQELLCDQKTTLRSLDKDLAASMYLWLNRREKGTQYSKLRPLGVGHAGLRILRWYGMHLPRNPDCPVCGDPEVYLERMRNAGITEDDVSSFEKTRTDKETRHA